VSGVIRDRILIVELIIAKYFFVARLSMTNIAHGEKMGPSMVQKHHQAMWTRPHIFFLSHIDDYYSNFDF